MVRLRKGTPQPEMWDWMDIVSNLGYDKTTAKEIMDEYRRRSHVQGYRSIEKHLILDFINEKQRQQRKREARYNADIATAESFAILKEQVATLNKMCDSSSEDARKARSLSLIANFISGISIAIAIITLVLNLN